MNKQAVTERINLTFQDNKKNEVELPFRILVLSNITADERAEDLVEHVVLKIDANITDILGRQNISVKLSLNNYLRPHIDEALMVNYSLNNLDDFSPENLIRGIPELRQALKMHYMLSDENVKSAILINLLSEFGFTDQVNLDNSESSL